MLTPRLFIAHHSSFIVHRFTPRSHLRMLTPRPFIAHHSSFIVHRSSFYTPFASEDAHSAPPFAPRPFIVHHSSFIVSHARSHLRMLTPHSSFIIHHSSFYTPFASEDAHSAAIHHSSFIIHRFTPPFASEDAHSALRFALCTLHFALCTLHSSLSTNLAAIQTFPILADAAAPLPIAAFTVRAAWTETLLPPAVAQRGAQFSG